MDLIGEWLRRVWYLLNRRRFDEALRREMDAHRAEMSRPARFGNALRLREEAQDVWGWLWLDHLVRDVAFSIRTLRRSPLFVAAATLILAVGVGVNLAFFQIVNAVLLQPYPLKDPPTLARFNRICCGRGDASSTITLVPPPMAGYVRRHSAVLSAVLTRRPADVDWGPDGMERVRAAFVSTNWFDELGATATLGRLFHERDDALLARTPVAVLSHDLWQRQFAGRQDAVGQVVLINDRAVTVIGVADPRFADIALPTSAAWLPMAHVDAFFNTGTRSDVDWTGGVELFGRFAPGVSASGVEEGLRATLAELSRDRPNDVRQGEWLEPLLASTRFMGPSERREALSLGIAAGSLTVLVLLIAALNLGNLMLARAISRVREMSIRSALGASRWRSLRYLVLEGGLVAAAGGVTGLGLGLVAAQVLASLSGAPRHVDLMPDWRTALVGGGAIALAALVVSLPAAWRVGRRDLALAVRDGGDRATAGLHSVRLRSLVIACQLAGCGVLLVFAGQMLQGLDRLRSTGLGFDFEDVAVLDPALAEHGMTPEAAFAYWADVRARVEANPGVASTALVTHAPLGSARSTLSYAGVPRLNVHTLSVEPVFFSMMRIPILSGRGFAPGDAPGTVTIVSRTVATRMYGRADVVGEPFPRGGSESVIVGVADDAHLFTPGAPNMGEAYGLLSPSSAANAVLLARARTDAARFPGLMRQASRAAAPHLSPETRLLRDDFAGLLQGPRLASSVAGLTAFLALALACLGITGVVSYVANRRTKEIGIRLALGATSASAVRTLLRGSAAAGVAGATLGLGGGWLVGRLFAGDPLYLEPLNLSPYVAAVVILALSACAAAIWPAIRLLRADPLKALRLD